MLLGLQGVDYRLYDPEIATTSLIYDIDNEPYFCANPPSKQSPISSAFTNAINIVLCLVSKS